MNPLSLAVQEKLKRLHQESLLDHVKFSEKLFKQLLSIDEELFFLQKKSLKEEVSRHPSSQPFEDYDLAGNVSNSDIGLDLLKQGRVGCIVMAGGQGSRLRFPGPKGCFPISPIEKKSLFQLLAEKIRAASHLAGKKLPLAIMTSSANERQTRDFFAEHQQFGLDLDQLFFYTQSDWPLLNLEGDLFLESQDSLAIGPNGNGRTLHDFYQCGIGEEWAGRGITDVRVMPIDNPLALPFDLELLGFHDTCGNQVTLQAIKRADSLEKVGVLAKIEGRLSVIEYTELSLEEKTANNEKGELQYGLANLSLFCFTMQFIKDFVIKNAQLPLHRAKKSAKMVNPNGHTIFSEEVNAWKFEQYIFDSLFHAQKVKALVYPREQIFAPLKNYKGEDSIETVQDALQKSDIQTFCLVSGLKKDQLANHAFELSQEFYYPTAELKKSWKDRLPIDKSYIEGFL